MILFKAVTAAAGIALCGGGNWGGYWGDLDGDRWPDLWVTHHSGPPLCGYATLYRNRRNGTFEDVTAKTFVAPLRRADRHGAGWADFDNDGDQDLALLVGAARGQGMGPKKLYVNGGGRLSDRAVALGVDYPLGRGRVPAWFDYDGDGLLDLVMSVGFRPDGRAPPTIFRQAASGFEDVGSLIGLKLVTAQFCAVSDISGDGLADLICNPSPAGRAKLFDASTIPLTDLTGQFLSGALPAEDFAVVDLNNDLRPDMYRTSRRNFSELAGDGPKGLIVSLSVPARREQGVQFVSDADVSIAMSLPPQLGLSLDDIYIGAQGIHPERDALRGETARLHLPSSDPRVHGIKPHVSGQQRGIYLGYDPTGRVWTYLLSATSAYSLLLASKSGSAIGNVLPIGFENREDDPPDQLLMNVGSTFADQSVSSGIAAVKNPGRAVVSGDFDNDMDVDLYVVNSGSVRNVPNLLYENDGKGRFTPVPGAAGASGPVFGVDKSAGVADYNRDGFLDVFVGTGNQLPGDTFNFGTNELFQNLGNGNHWIEVDLEGVSSNRDGIGAKVFAKAGGVTQVREQGGDVHASSQDFRRIHFGLGRNTHVDLSVHWPSGIQQRVTNLPANQIIQVVERADELAPGPPALPSPSTSGAFIWKRRFDGPYYIDLMGSGAEVKYTVRVIAAGGVTFVRGVGLEEGDVLTHSAFGLKLESSVSTGKDEVVFGVRPGAVSLIAIESDGVAVRRQVFFGRTRGRAALSGWIKRSDAMPMRPALTEGERSGLSVGRGLNDEAVEFRWRGGTDRPHWTRLITMTAAAGSFVPVGLESGQDTVRMFVNGVTVEGWSGPYWDGLNAVPGAPAEIGFLFQADGLTQSDKVNPYANPLGRPNAFELPRATPWGMPAYQASRDRGVFVWKDGRGAWHLRVTAGRWSAARYRGSVVSGRPAASIRSVGLERTDVLATPNPGRVNLDFGVSPGGEDGVDLEFAVGETIRLDISESGSKATGLVRIGSQRWRVNALPVDLSGW